MPYGTFAGATVPMGVLGEEPGEGNPDLAGSIRWDGDEEGTPRQNNYTTIILQTISVVRLELSALFNSLLHDPLATVLL
jgi:hypothetical protein